MVSKKRGKRKNAAKDLLFEVSDNDVSADNSDSECNEPEKKVLKTGSNFIESVVTAICNLENEAKKEKQCSTTEVIEIIDESSQDSRKVGEDSDVSLIVIEDKSVVENEESLSQGSQNLECTQDIIQDEESLLILSDSCTIIEEGCKSNTNKSNEADRVSEDFKSNEPIENDVEDGELTSETDSPEPTIVINFSTKSISDLYKSKFVDFLSSFKDLSILKQDDLSIILIKDRLKKAHECITLDETERNDGIAIHQKHSEITANTEASHKKKKRKKAKKEKDLFVLDTTPSQPQTQVMKYSSKFQIDIVSEKETENEKEKVKFSQTCFNCDQKHALKDCPLPKNYVKINMKRQQLQKNKEKQRYHLEEDQKFAHLAPGKISEKLRDALGIKQNQLPPYIYQMRQFGYPPGWLEEAKFVYSNLTMFDSDGNNVRSQNLKKNQALDPAKIIEYPGFNVPMEKYCKDEFRHHRVPPYSNEYSKKAMIEYFEKEYSKQQDDFETQDMDVDVSAETNDYATCSAKELETCIPSPSLVALETEKQNLLAALDDTSNSNLKSDNGETSNTEQTEVEPPPPGIDNSPSEGLTKVSSQSSISSIGEGSQEISKKVIHSNFGTPILKSCSPYSNLPNPDNFMKDVSPVINFENLPNSTGTYEKMVGLLHKVRSTMKSFHKSDDS